MAEPCFNFQGKEKDFNLTPRERRPIWEYMKANYLDQGQSLEDSIQEMSNATGAPPRFFYEAVVGPKSERVRTAEMFAKEGNRRRAIEQARDLIRKADTPGFVKAMKAVSELPRASLTALHGGVFPVTHGGGLLLRPTAYPAFVKGWWTSWKSISTPAYERARLQLVTDPVYAYARDSGLKVNPDEGPQGILSGWLSSKPGWSKKAWLGLQVMRQELFKQYLSRFPKEMWDKDLGQHLAEIANHSTGVTNIQMGVIGKSMFAPQLTASKFTRAFVDPAKTLDTFARMEMGYGKTVTAGERAAAYQRLKNASEFIGVTVGGLMLNQALLSWAGSKQKINFSDPLKSDWMRFKTGNGYVLSTRGPEEFLRLAGHLVAISNASKRELHGQQPQAAAWETVSRFAQYKVAPGPGVIGELGYGRDLFGRPLPPPVQAARKAIGLTPQVGTPKKPQYTTPEYLLEKGPIFIGGGAREIYESLREHGASDQLAMDILRGAAVSAGEFLGFGAYKETPKR